MQFAHPLGVQLADLNYFFRTTPMLPVKSGSITPAFTSSSYSVVRPDLDINWA